MKNEEMYSLTELRINRFPKYSRSELEPAVRNYDGDFITAYLKDTIWYLFLTVPAHFWITWEMEMEHTHILGATGSGKSQLIQSLFLKDVSKVSVALSKTHTVIVIDSQGDLINKIKNLEIIKPERLVIIDPTDVEYPIALNIFDIGQERLEDYSQLEYERHINGVIELLTFVFSSILGAELTQKQGVALNFVLRLMLFIPNATIHTLRDILSPKGLEPYKEYLENLTESGQAFFANEFNSKSFDETKTQVLRRLYGLLENPTLERLFTHKRSKFDMKKEMDEGKVILINTAKDLLKSQGCSFFGRFFISLIAQATQERASQFDRLPVHVFIDEAQDYLDSNISTLLEQARKYNVGITIAHQQMSQLPPDVQASVRTNTAIKFVSGCSTSDARLLAEDMRCDHTFLLNQPKLTFATYIKGFTKTAVPVHAQAGMLENFQKRSEAEMIGIIELNRRRYSTKSATGFRKDFKKKSEKAAKEPDDDFEDINKA